MELTRRCDYACRILRSAYRHRDGYVSIADVAEEEEIPYAFARTIQHDLATAGFLKTVRGARGGLSLSIDPGDTTILDVLRVLQGPVTVAPCAIDPESCSLSEGCTFNRVWIAADEALSTLFGSLTLKDVFDGSPDGAFLDDARNNVNAQVVATVESFLSNATPPDCGVEAAREGNGESA
ncbi:MAG: Rrf2 family transcriptional regulator [Eggerthellaceae bacterium]|nr:Rrf2 family transcriptional regulator [Eggerthellaceae bacterium]